MFYFVVLSIFASQEFRSHDFALLINRKQHFTVGLIHLHVAFISRICFWLPLFKMSIYGVLCLKQSTGFSPEAPVQQPSVSLVEDRLIV